MNSGIKFDIVYELRCGRVAVITAPDGASEICYWLEGDTLMTGSTLYRKGMRSPWRRLRGEAHDIVIPYGRGHRFEVKEKDYINIFQNC
jgi:hypothetical protein